MDRFSVVVVFFREWTEIVCMVYTKEEVYMFGVCYHNRLNNTNLKNSCGRHFDGIKILNSTSLQCKWKWNHRMNHHYKICLGCMLYIYDQSTWRFDPSNANSGYHSSTLSCYSTYKTNWTIFQQQQQQRRKQKNIRRCWSISVVMWSDPSLFITEHVANPIQRNTNEATNNNKKTIQSDDLICLEQNKSIDVIAYNFLCCEPIELICSDLYVSSLFFLIFLIILLRDEGNILLSTLWSYELYNFWVFRAHLRATFNRSPKQTPTKKKSNKNYWRHWDV